jgi:hypothetical protein
VRIFPAEVEERAFRLGLARDWESAGLVDAPTAAKITAELGPPPARAAWPLRLVLFGFTTLCVAALVGLFVVNDRDRTAVGLFCLFAAAFAAAGAERLIRAYAFHRHGVEEALVAAAAVLLALGVERTLDAGRAWSDREWIFPAALAAASALAYARYGYRLAAIGVAAGLGLLVASFDVGENWTRVLLAALYAGLLAALAFAPGLPRRERERLEIARFFLALSVPLALNVRLEYALRGYEWYGGRELDAFGWLTFAAIFALPAAAFAWGVVSRSRALLWAGALDFLVAQCSVKPYFGLARNSWDPAALGAELIAAALLLKRWLDAGPGGRRGAYSSREMGGSRAEGALGLLAGAAAAAPAAATRAPDVPRGEGGGFGGGGASGSF